MTYQLIPDEPFPKAFQRIAAGECAYAIELIQTSGPKPEAVHLTRKAIKRLRALLRLARPSLGDTQFRQENRRLRDAAASLSGARDAEVMLSTLNNLSDMTSAKKFEAMTATFRKWLEARRDERVAALDAAALKHTIRMLQEADEQLAALKLKPLHGEGLALGLRDMMRNGRRNFVQAFAGEDPEDFHEYRKSVQLYHRHMQLFQQAWPELIGVHVSAAKTLSDILGDVHDLSVLHDAVASHRKLFPTRSKMEHLSELIESRQQDLQQQAFPDGQRLFMCEKPSAFAARMVGYLAAAQKTRPKE